MYKLLRAGFFRLKKDVIFWLFIFATIIIARYLLWYSNRATILDSLLNKYIWFIGILIAIFISIFVGKEFSEGIIRNKIIVGHSRTSIYISKLIISVITSILCEIIYIAIILLIGIPLYGKLQMPTSQFAMSMLNTFLIITSFCSIYHFITMICPDITVSVTINILIFIAMFIASSSLEYIANSPKYITHTFTDNEVSYIISQEPNPNYPGDQKVKQAKILYLSIPQGQAMAIFNNEAELLSQMPIYSVILIIVVNICGIYLFSKKELK